MLIVLLQAKDALFNFVDFLQLSQFLRLVLQLGSQNFQLVLSHCNNNNDPIVNPCKICNPWKAITIKAIIVQCLIYPRQYLKTMSYKQRTLCEINNQLFLAYSFIVSYAYFSYSGNIIIAHYVYK